MATILDEYITKHQGSAKRYTESTQIFPGGVTHDSRYAQPFPLFMTHGEGPRKWDVDGNEFIDYMCAYGPMILGYGNPVVDEFITIDVPETSAGYMFDIVGI